MTVITKLCENFKNMEDLIDNILDIYIYVIKNVDFVTYEYKDAKTINWFSIGCEQGFSVSLGVGNDRPRFSLISIIEDETKYNEISRIETYSHEPIFTALLSVLIPRLQRQLEEDLSEKLSEDFEVFVFTDDERSDESECEVPDYEDYFYHLEDDGVEKKVIIDWIKSFCSTEKLRNYLLDIMDDKYQGQKLKELSKQWE